MMRRVLYAANMLGLAAVVFVIPVLAIRAFGWWAPCVLPLQIVLMAECGHNLTNLTNDPKETDAP